MKKLLLANNSLAKWAKAHCKRVLFQNPSLKAGVRNVTHCAGFSRDNYFTRFAKAHKTWVRSHNAGLKAGVMKALGCSGFSRDNYFILFLIAVFFAFTLLSCNQKASNDDEDVQPSEVVTPVTVTNPTSGNMAETVVLNAVSSFLLKTSVKANTTGYLQKVNAQLGKYVSKGQVLFEIKTKEAAALGNTINTLDTSLHFQGTVTIKAPDAGFVSDLTLTTGDYVQEGEQLAAITNTKSFVFLLDLPYELKPYLPNNKVVQLHLPDSTVLNGSLQAPLPVADSATQTQRYIIHVNSNQSIPENLIAKVYLIKSAKQNAMALPKAAVLSDEVQREFWIMKMINDSTAVKVPVKKGMETKDNVEIVSPPLSPSDKILLTGNYGLPDTAKVKVMNSEQ